MDNASRVNQYSFEWTICKGHRGSSAADIMPRQSRAAKKVKVNACKGNVRAFHTTDTFGT
jgi:hypothetical protein